MRTTWAMAAVAVMSVMTAGGSAQAAAEKCPNMLILLDRSSSMAGYKWKTAVDAVNAFTAERQGFMRFGLVVFPTIGAHCGRGSALVRSDFYAADDIRAALDLTRPSGDMTPTGDAVKFAGEQTPDMSDTERRKFVILVTDGDPTCPDASDGERNVVWAEQHLSSLLARGIKTFVIGFGRGAKPEKLDRLADAGGTARVNGTCTDPHSSSLAIPCRYYEATDQASLTEAFDQIARATEAEIGGRTCNDSCYRPDGCPEGQKCVKEVHDYAGGKYALNLGKCAPDACFGMACGADEFCRDGTCHKACVEGCPGTRICRDGSCVEDPCDQGNCACASPCPRNLECIEGSCEDNPCLYMNCPESAPFCDRGHCYAPASSPPQGSTDPLDTLPRVPDPKRPNPGDHGQMITEPGGCACSAPGRAAAAVLLVVAGLVLLRRRR